MTAANWCHPPNDTERVRRCHPTKGIVIAPGLLAFPPSPMGTTQGLRSPRVRRCHPRIEVSEDALVLREDLAKQFFGEEFRKTLDGKNAEDSLKLEGALAP